MSDAPPTAYGVDLDGGRTTVVRARRRGRAIVYDTLASAQPAGDPATAALAATIAGEQHEGRAAVALAAPAQDSVLRLLETPFAAPAKARAVLPSLLDVQLPFPLEQCASQFLLPPAPRGAALRAVGVAVPSDRLNELLAAQRLAGFDADVIDHEAVALWRLAPGPGPVVVLYLGHERTVAVAGANGIPSAAFGIRTGWNTAIPANDKITMRLRQFLAGAFGAQADEARLVAAGPLARPALPGLAAQPGFAADRARLAENAETALARSLARAALDPDVTAVNLRTGPLEHPARLRRRETAQRRLHWSVRLAALLLIAAGFGAPALLERRHAARQGEIQERARTITGATTVPRGQELFVAEQFLAGAREQFLPFRQWLEPSAYPLFASLLTEAQSRDQRIETVSVRPDALIVRGSGADWSDPERLAQTAVREGWRVDIEREDAGHDERVHYTLRAGR